MRTKVQGYNSNFLHGNILMKKVVLWCFLMSEMSEKKSLIQIFEFKSQFRLYFFFQLKDKSNQDMIKTPTFPYNLEK